MHNPLILNENRLVMIPEIQTAICLKLFDDAQCHASFTNISEKCWGFILQTGVLDLQKDTFFGERYNERLQSSWTIVVSDKVAFEKAESGVTVSSITVWKQSYDGAQV